MVGLISSVCVVRRIGGRNSHPDFHRAPSSCRDKNLERSNKQGDKTLITIITQALQLQGGQWLTHYHLDDVVKEPSLVRNLYLKENFTRTFLRSLSAGGLPWLMARRNAGIGGILSLHRICHPKPYEFASQDGLSTTPENFRRIFLLLIGRGYHFLSLIAFADWFRYL